MAAGFFDDELSARRQAQTTDLEIKGLQEAFGRIDELVEGPSGVRRLLDTFEINIKHVLHRTAVRQVRAFKRAKVVLSEEYPEEAIMVFGEEASISIAIQTLLDNILKHSQATRAHIRVRPDPPYAYVVLVDNGTGLLPNMVLGFGYSSATTALNKYCGSVVLRGATEQDSSFPILPSTIVTIRLHLVHKRVTQ
jgi:hypothetical protein